MMLGVAKPLLGVGVSKVCVVARVYRSLGGEVGTKRRISVFFHVVFTALVPVGGATSSTSAVLCHRGDGWDALGGDPILHPRG